MIITVLQSDVSIRLDVFLAKRLKCSRSSVQKFIKRGDLLLNDKVFLKPSHSLVSGDVLSFPDDVLDVPDRVLVSEDLGINIIYENDDFLVIDKPAGIVVHASSNGHFSGTVVNGVLSHLSLDGLDSVRPGIVHRLDKDTSGLMVVAKNINSYSEFVDLFKSHSVEKKYLALVKGVMEYKVGIVDSPISRSVVNRKKMDVVSVREGKSAITRYSVVSLSEYEPNRFVSLLDVNILTGRTHQIRVHMSSMGHPVVMDSAYGVTSFNKSFVSKFGLKRLFLHAYSLKFVFAGVDYAFKCPLPVDLSLIVDRLGLEDLPV